MGELLFELIEKIGMWWFLFIVVIGIPVLMSFIGFVFQEIEASKANRRINKSRQQAEKKGKVVSPKPESPIENLSQQKWPEKGPALSPFVNNSRKPDDVSAPSSSKVVQFQRKTK